MCFRKDVYVYVCSLCIQMHLAFLFLSKTFKNGLEAFLSFCLFVCLFVFEWCFESFCATQDAMAANLSWFLFQWLCHSVWRQRYVGHGNLQMKNQDLFRFAYLTKSIFFYQSSKGQFPKRTKRSHQTTLILNNQRKQWTERACHFFKL